MASRGAMVTGTNGADFQHREQIAIQYQISALNKSRLRYTTFFHYLLFLMMLLKLSVDILDKLDIFIMEIEVLMVPPPLLWEYLWASSLLPTFIGLTAIKKNNIRQMYWFIYGIFLLGFGPIAYCFVYYFDDVWSYLTTDWDKIKPDTADGQAILAQMQLWRNQPYGLMWYIFVILASQVHFFQLFFSFNLLKAWRNRKKPAL